MASHHHHLGGHGLVGGDVTTPAPTSFNKGRGEDDVGMAVLLMASSSSVFGDGELQWQAIGR